MNQIKQKIEEIGLSQREISKRLGRNASYLAGVFRTGLSASKQNELMDDLEIVAGGGTILSNEKLLELVDDQLEKLTVQLLVEQKRIAELKDELLEAQDNNASLQSTFKWIKKDIDNLELSLDHKQVDLTWSQKCLLEANKEIEDLKKENSSLVYSGWIAVCLVIMGIIFWSVV